MPDIESQVFQTYAPQGVLVYGIHPGESASKLEDFRKQTGVTFPFVADQGTLERFDFSEGTGYPYPRDVVIGKDLRIHSIKNSFDAAEIDALIRALLAEEP